MSLIHSSSFLQASLWCGEKKCGIWSSHLGEFDVWRSGKILCDIACDEDLHLRFTTWAENIDAAIGIDTVKWQGTIAPNSCTCPEDYKYCASSSTHSLSA